MSHIDVHFANQIGPPSFYRKALSLAFPVMAQMLLQNMVSLIDNFMVADLGDVSMAGVNIAGQINFIFLVLIGAVTLSAGIFMSQYNGAKNSDGMRHAFRFKIIVTMSAAILYMIFSRFFSTGALNLMVLNNHQSTEIVAKGVSYMQVAAYTWIPTVISISIGSSFREIGLVKAPLIISVIATLINTFFNWIFIYGNLGAPRLEVEGAAIATIIARCTEALLFIIYIRQTKPPFFSRLIEILQIKRTLFLKILVKSAMILIPEMSWVLTETVVIALYNSRGGADVVSGMSAGFAIANLFFICFGGIQTVAGVILGSSLGANELDLARIQKKWIFSGTIFFGIFMGILGFFTIFLIPIVFGNLSEAAQVITRGMVNALYLPVYAYNYVHFAVSRTGGDTTLALVTNVSVNIFLVLPGMFALVYLTPLGSVVMFAIIKATDFVKIIIASAWLKKEHWVRNLTDAES